MEFIARQPNGLLCRHSSIVDCITDYNLTDEDYVAMCMEKAKAEAYDVLKNHIRPFSDVEKCFVENNMSRQRFEELLMEMKKPKERCHWKRP